jgi:uncharacterized protein YhbP (UPF0306 family)
MKGKLERVRSLLLSQTTLALATADENSMPRATPLFYVADDALRLNWFSSRSSLHSRNLARNPQVSVAIFREVESWRQIQGVQMQGSVAVISDKKLRESITKDYCERFQLGNLFALAIGRSALYCFTPSWLRYIDNTRRFGYKFELELKITLTKVSSRTQ